MKCFMSVWEELGSTGYFTTTSNSNLLEFFITKVSRNRNCVAYFPVDM